MLLEDESKCQNFELNKKHTNQTLSLMQNLFETQGIKDRVPDNVLS